MASEQTGEIRPTCEGFPSRERIRLRRDFDRAYRSGLRCWARHLVIHAAPNGLPHARIGLTVSRKVGGAVVRNRVKRRLREAFRRNKRRVSRGLDLVVTAKLPLAEQSWEQLERDYLSALREASRKSRRASRRAGPSRSSVSTS